MNREERTQRLYQWLTQRASFFRSGTSSRGANRIVRTEVTIEQESITLSVNGSAPAFDLCPLCGQPLAPEHVELARLRLHKGFDKPELRQSSSRTSFPQIEQNGESK